MFSFLDQPLFETNTIEAQRGTPLDGAPRDSFLSAGQLPVQAQKPQLPPGSAPQAPSVYGAHQQGGRSHEGVPAGGNGGGAGQQQLHPPLAAQLLQEGIPMQCRDPESLHALERMLKNQQAAEKRMTSMEHRIVGMMDQMVASRRTDKRPPGLAGNTLLWIAASTALVIAVVILCQRRRAAPIEVLMRAPGGGGAVAPIAAPAAGTPIVLGPASFAHLGPGGAPQSFLA
jgi:hypothetical protein